MLIVRLIIRYLWNHRRIVYGFVTCLSIFVTVKIISSMIIDSKEILVSCYRENSYFNDGLEVFDPHSTVEPSIFFHETSCFGESDTILTPRQACAVESAASLNPNKTVYLFYLSPSRLSKDSKILYEQLMRYKNVKIKRIIVNEYIKKTPLEEWYNPRILKTSDFPNTHMSDILKFLTLWKYGGIGLDLDFITMKSMQNLKNFVGTESWEEEVASGVIGLSNRDFGHYIAQECLKDLKSNFRGDIWGNNGAGVITRTLKKICKATSIKEFTPERCHNFRVYPPQAFYPIFYLNWKQFFDVNKVKSTMKHLRNSTGVLVWNKFSKTQNIPVGQRVPYSIIAKTYCPRVYAHSKTMS